MIRAIIKLQDCKGKPGRRAFVGRGYSSHGIARGAVRYYEAIGPSWHKIRRAAAQLENGTMGYSAINPHTAEVFQEINSDPPLLPEAGAIIRPMPKGWKPESQTSL